MLAFLTGNNLIEIISCYYYLIKHLKFYLIAFTSNILAL